MGEFARIAESDVIIRAEIVNFVLILQTFFKLHYFVFLNRS